jgi:hypothetical protein
MARMPDREEAIAVHGTGNREASGYMKGSFQNASSSTWTLPGLAVALGEFLLTVLSILFDGVAMVLGYILMLLGALAGAFKKIGGICSDTRDEMKAAFVNWKNKKDRVAKRAEQLEALESQ